MPEAQQLTRQEIADMLEIHAASLTALALKVRKTPEMLWHPLIGSSDLDVLRHRLRRVSLEVAALNVYLVESRSA